MVKVVNYHGIPWLSTLDHDHPMIIGDRHLETSGLSAEAWSNGRLPSPVQHSPIAWRLKWIRQGHGMGRGGRGCRGCRGRG